MTFLRNIIFLCCSLLSVHCSKDILGVDGSTNGNGRTPPPVVVIKRSTQEDYNAKRFSNSKYINSNAGVAGGGIFSVSYQDIYFDDAAGNPSDAVRPVIEKNLLLVELTMQYQKANKGGVQEFGNGTEIKFNAINLLTSPNQSSTASQARYHRRNFAFTRDGNGVFSGAAGYEGSTEIYDKDLMNFNYTLPAITVANSDTVNDFSEPVSVGAAISFDSGGVYLTSNDAVIALNRTVSKGSIISFEKLREASSPFPYVPSVVSYELLNDTNQIRIPKDEIKYILDILRFSTGVPKTFGVKYPVWMTVIESGVSDTLTLHHRSTGEPFSFAVYQYFEFGRKIYFK